MGHPEIITVLRRGYLHIVLKSIAAKPACLIIKVKGNVENSHAKLNQVQKTSTNVINGLQGGKNNKLQKCRTWPA